MRQLPWKTLLTAVALLLLAAGAAVAQEDTRAAAEAERARAEAQRAAAEAERAAAEARLEEARARLEEAAREIAELTVDAMGDARIVIRSEMDDINRPRPVLLGVNIGAVGSPENREEGVQVVGVTPDSAADAAGIRSGDVLLSIEGKRLDWSDDTAPTEKLLDHLSTTEPGSRLKIEHRRDGEVLTADVEARPRPEGFDFDFDFEELHRSLPPGGQAFVSRFLTDRWGDMELVELTPGLGDYFETDEGVLVVRAPSDETLGLEDGDVILDIAGRKPADPRHVVRILRSYEPGERLVMTVVRKGRRQQLEADIPE
jgi:type II secretory pathway component PulC